MESHDYQDLTLIDLYINHDDEFAIEQLIKKYVRLIWSLVFKYRVAIDVMGIHKDDMYQEGVIGFYESIKAYDRSLHVPFRCFAKVCVERQIQSLIRKYYGQSYSLLHRSYPLDMIVSDDENLTLEDTIACNNPLYSPVSAFNQNQNYQIFKQAMSQMDLFHQKIMHYRLSGYTYMEIAELCECSCKSVDNALQRVKKKLKPLFD